MIQNRVVHEKAAAHFDGDRVGGKASVETVAVVRTGKEGRSMGAIQDFIAYSTPWNDDEKEKH